MKAPSPAVSLMLAAVAGARSFPSGTLFIDETDPRLRALGAAATRDGRPVAFATADGSYLFLHGLAYGAPTTGV